MPARLIRLLCLLLCAHLAVAPLSHVHAHVAGDDHEHIRVHGGHDHALHAANDVTPDHGHQRSSGWHAGHAFDDTDAHDHELGTHAIDLSADTAKPPAGAKALVWIAVLWTMLFTISVVWAPGVMRPPPRTRTLASSPYPHPVPLLRGPPLSI